MKKMMAPLWLAYPEIERYSIGWRMGGGEDYRYKFFEWFSALSAEEQASYKKMFPEPITWKGWWDDEDKTEMKEYDDISIQLWRPQGTPKYSCDWLIGEMNKGMKPEFVFFWKHQPEADGVIGKSCLSNMWLCDFRSMDADYSSTEQFMMVQKATLFGNPEIGRQMKASSDPVQIKALGRQVKGFDQDIWNEVKYPVVLNGNWCKFSQNQELGQYLLSTGDKILVEASPEDAVWGIKLSQDSHDASKPSKWQGENLLGFALMEIRDELRRITQNKDKCVKL